MGSGVVLEEIPVVFYDGHCYLCHGAVKFILKRDKKRVFRFAQLQSDLAEFLEIDQEKSRDTVVLKVGEKRYDKSRAFFEICKRLPLPWPFIYPLILIPPFIRNSVYDLVSRNRYKWFGKSESCLLPTKDFKDRHIQNVADVGIDPA